MSKLIALKAMRYAGKPVKAQEPFQTVNDRDARLLIGAKLAMEAPPLPVQKKAEPPARKVAAVERAMPKDEPKAEDAPPIITPDAVEAVLDEKPKRRYFRRDMTADGK